MGGAVSSGRDNDELVDNLIDAEFITTKQTEKVFRAVDRGNYYLPEHRSSAYKDGAWRHGSLHLSAPCIYTKVVESLNLKPGLSFLNLGSGTGYLSTMIGLILGSSGVNHGIEYHLEAIDYAKTKLEEFIQNCICFDEFDFCSPVFVHGNFLKISATNVKYDRLYCGAGCPENHLDYVKNFLKIGGIAVVPFGDQLLKIKRLNETEFKEKSLHSVAFANLIPVHPDDDMIDLPEVTVTSLKSLCRTFVRILVRKNIQIWKGELDIPRRKQNKVRQVPDRSLILVHSLGGAVDHDEEASQNRGEECSEVTETQEEMEVSNNTTAEPSPTPGRSGPASGDSALGTSVSSCSQSDHLGPEDSHDTEENTLVVKVPVNRPSADEPSANELSAGDREVVGKSADELSSVTNPAATSNSPKRSMDSEDENDSDNVRKTKRAMCSHHSLTPEQQASCSCATSNDLGMSSNADSSSSVSDSVSDSSSQSSNDSYSSELDEHDPADQNNSRRIYETLMRVIDRDSEPIPLSEEDDKERVYNLNKAKHYHVSFAEAMTTKVNSLPLPKSLKNYLLYYRS